MTNEEFEELAQKFYEDTRYLPPVKSETRVCYYTGREEERELAWKSWISGYFRGVKHARSIVRGANNESPR